MCYEVCFDLFFFKTWAFDLLLNWSFSPYNFFLEGRKKCKTDGSDSGEENLSKKDLALQLALDQITTSFGKGAIMWLGRSHTQKDVPVISTGSFSLDIALGIGGLPKVTCLLFLSDSCDS